MVIEKADAMWQSLQQETSDKSILSSVNKLQDHA